MVLAHRCRTIFVPCCTTGHGRYCPLRSGRMWVGGMVVVTPRIPRRMGRLFRVRSGVDGMPRPSTTPTCHGKCDPAVGCTDWSLFSSPRVSESTWALPGTLERRGVHQGMQGRIRDPEERRLCQNLENRRREWIRTLDTDTPVAEITTPPVSDTGAEILWWTRMRSQFQQRRSLVRRLEYLGAEVLGPSATSARISSPTTLVVCHLQRTVSPRTSVGSSVGSMRMAGSVPNCPSHVRIGWLGRCGSDGSPLPI